MKALNSMINPTAGRYANNHIMDTIIDHVEGDYVERVYSVVDIEVALDIGLTDVWTYKTVVKMQIDIDAIE